MIHWALNETIEVTSVSRDAYLITRTNTQIANPGSDPLSRAFVIEFDPDGPVNINGQPVDLGPDLIIYCAIIDDANNSADPGHLGSGLVAGATVTLDPNDEMTYPRLG
jgi:hypothetical protein